MGTEGDSDEVVAEFLVESRENLDQLDRDLVALEESPSSRELLSSIFRTVHTIKGSCGFLGFGKLESVAHHGESLLSRLRDGALPFDEHVASALLALGDALREMLACIEKRGNEGDGDYEPLIETLTALEERGPGLAALEVPPPAAPPAAAALSQPTAPAAPPVAPPPDPPAPGTVVESTIRVDVGLLDRLMNLVGELVLSRNHILQLAGSRPGATLAAATQRLDLITTELQVGVMRTRMQPIGSLWGKLPRVVRDLAVACGKRVRLETDGDDTELDKTVLEAIKDPLIHLVRNAVDHGIERPDVRTAAGKPPEGVLRLRAHHEAGQVNIEIADDGGGIRPDLVRERAVERGLLTPEQAAATDDAEAVGLIFLPGFSTATQVTNVSGRGVGMDVVRTNIERIGGTVDVQSRPGAGSVMRIRIPLTLAIIPALIVNAAGDRYAIPRVSLVELVRLDGERARTGIEQLYGAPVYRLRGKLLPVVELGEVLGVEPARTAPREVVHLVVLQAGDQQLGLVVDEIHDSEEIVVKPLGPYLAGLTAFAGATIMGDGRVALILDVPGLAAEARVVTSLGQRSAAEAARDDGPRAERQPLLVCGVGERTRLAIPLAQVARIEEFPRASVERGGDHDVVQYRGDILPLLRIAQLLKLRRREAAGATGPLTVVVYADGGRSVGLVVDQVLDIVEQAVTIRRRSRRRGVTGSIVVQERVTDVLDVRALLDAADPSLLTRGAGAPAEA
jgi:two-component system chemotaxis sensor kinase CheA